MDEPLRSCQVPPIVPLQYCQKAGVQLTPVEVERFPDSELHVEVQESVRSHVGTAAYGRCLSPRRGNPFNGP
jgi:hypothetical protein